MPDPSREFEPAYRKLPEGELRRRAAEAAAGLADCRFCPRECGADRAAGGEGFCRTGRRARVSSFFPHFGEEDCLRGRRGSGTVFFSGCNLHCVFCQNFDISQGGAGEECGPARIAAMMLELQALGCHNINWVTPEHVVPQVLEALAQAAEGGLCLPIVYNTSAYDSPHSLRLLSGIVDIYMPDFKIWDPQLAKTYLQAEDYPAAARAAVREMHRQVGDLQLNEHGLAVRGLLVRHLVMPDGVASTPEVMRFLVEEISPDTYVNLMAQYRPAGKVHRGSFDRINRPITAEEYDRAFAAARAAGLHRFDQRSRF
ncbi:MAG: radical SAM protein [Anaerolineales bacterium]|nr:radical SAM protein [Anaerolineales bacterium]